MDSTLFTVVLPISLAIIMFSMGLTLTLPDFKRLVQRPRGVLVGVIMQIVNGDWKLQP